MCPRPSALAPLRVLLPRACVVYAALRGLLLALAGILAAVAGRGAADGLDSPAGIVALATVLGAIDIRRRGETLLWANLGYPPVLAPGCFGAVALVAELLAAWALA